MTDDTARRLGELSPAELEALWLEPVELPPPRGVYRGEVLQRIDTPAARRPLWRVGQRLGFELTPFGIDFDRRLWFFFSPRLAIGRFVADPGPSRWRDTDAIRLRYHVSRLPRLVRRALYDEVKPLSERRMMGIGGVNAGPGVGERFFFSLERVG